MNYHISKNAHIHFWGYLNQILTSSEIRDPMFKPPWFMWSHVIVSNVHVHTGIQPYRENLCVIPSACRHAFLEGITVTSDMLVWSLENPLVGDISSPFRPWLSYLQSNASMAPVQYSTQAEVHRVKLCSKASGSIIVSNRENPGACDSPWNHVSGKENERLHIVIFYRFVCKSLCRRLCLG